MSRENRRVTYTGTETASDDEVLRDFSAGEHFQPLDSELRENVPPHYL
ncbi:MAG: hypothetical protein LBL41_05245 [Bifidobacteriaceae bacterium]|jgi:hypothetical protein|nr:hypothetical protein [Bifidobacteriaceae bacterium]